MQSDFDLIKYQFESNADITIIPIADVHLGAAEHMAEDWIRFCKWLEGRPNTYITLGGDLINNATKSSVSNVFDDVLRPREQKRKIVEMLTPVKDKILCAVAGNHERRSGKDADDDVTYDILAKLDIEDIYRENMAFIKISIGDKNVRGHANPTYMLAVTHGAGGGILTGGSVNRDERFAYAIDGLDCLICGHTHKPFVTQPSKIVVDPYNNCVSLKPFKVVCSTSWLNYGGYAASKMLLPSSYATQVITLAGNRKEILVTM